MPLPASVDKGCCETESPCCEEGIIRDAGDCMVSTCCPGPSKVEKGKYYPLGKRVPSFLNPYTLENGGVMLSYFDVGVAIYFLVAPLSYYLISELNVSSTAYSAYATLISLPWSLKFVFGLISDMNPIYGYRRKSWLLLGWLAFSGFSFFLASLGEPDLTYTAIFMFLMTVSYLQSDVCTDCLAVERARYETEVHKGSLQTSGYTIRAFGMLIGAICGTLLYNTSSWGWGLTVAQLFALNALIPLFGVVPGAWWLEELASNQPPQTLVQHLESVWKTLQLRAVWWPMIFIYSYSVFQIPNSAWTNFLVIALGFTDFELGLLTIAGCAIFWVGMIIYKSFFFETSWRTIYIVTGVIGAVFSVLQVILILRLNVAWGIPDLYFALGDTAIVTLMQAVQAMPACIMFVMLCPEGSEGVTYALLTTISNLAGAVGSDIGSAMTLIWAVDNDTLESGDYSGMLKLTILTSCLQVTPLLWVWILPDSKEDQRKLLTAGDTSYEAGLTLLIVIIVSLLVTIALSIYFIFVY